MKMKYTKAEHSWMFYDWAGSAFSIIVTTAVFPIYYSSAAELSGVSDANSTAYLGYTISIFTFIVALLSPLLGTMADIQGFKKTLFPYFLFTWSIRNFKSCIGSSHIMDIFTDWLCNCFNRNVWG